MPTPGKQYECTLKIPVGMVIIDAEGNHEIIVAEGQKITADEMAVVGAINELLAKLRFGKLIEYSPVLGSFQNDKEVIKCEWLRSGNLKIHGSTKVVYHYAETAERAMSERRTFTCPRSLISSLPKHRNWNEPVVPFCVPNVSSGNKLEQGANDE